MSSKSPTLPTSRGRAPPLRSIGHAARRIRALVRPICGRGRDDPGRLKSAVPLASGGRTHHGAAANACARCCACSPARLWNRERKTHRSGRIHRVRAHATLLHERRGRRLDENAAARATANNIFGNQASVLVGDFVYSRAFQMWPRWARNES